jgi:D-alanyl-D-alanine carboxypeptidase
MLRLTSPLALWLLTACGTAALDPNADPTSVTRSRLEQMVADELPGIQYVVVDRDGIVFESARGVRDVATKQPMQLESLQMAYSMTKALTAIATMKLIEQGKLELDAPLSDYFDAHPYGTGVTIRSLLAQTSGVPNPMPLDWFEAEGVAFDRDELLQQRLRENPELLHAPGSEYQYSNLSYWLLEAAVESASEGDYADYLAQHVLKPNGVQDAQARFTLGPADSSATGHSRRFSLTNLFVGWMSPSQYWRDTSGPWRRTARVVPHGRGYGGLFTNASALAAVLQDLLREQPVSLSSASRDLMFTAQKTTGGEPIPMTLGWVVQELQGERYFGKPGGGLGFHGNLRVYPRLGLATVLLANSTELSAGPIDQRSDKLDEAFVAAERRTLD